MSWLQIFKKLHLGTVSYSSDTADEVGGGNVNGVCVRVCVLCCVCVCLCVCVCVSVCTFLCMSCGCGYCNAHFPNELNVSV